MVENRPWGSFIVFVDEFNYKVKKIFVNPNSKLSLQSHKQRSEYWVVVVGEAIATLHDEELILLEGDHLIIPANAKHRLANETENDLILIEVQMGNCIEEDIIRYDDDYGRESSI